MNPLCVCNLIWFVFKIELILVLLGKYNESQICGYFKWMKKCVNHLFQRNERKEIVSRAASKILILSDLCLRLDTQSFQRMWRMINTRWKLCTADVDIFHHILLLPSSFFSQLFINSQPVRKFNRGFWFDVIWFRLKRFLFHHLNQ